MASKLDLYAQDEQRWSEYMIRAHQGDRAVYERLLTELGNAIEVYVRVRFGNLSMLEDCVQESLLAIHKARHTYDQDRPFRPWMFTIVRHRTIDVLRRDSACAAVSVPAIDELGSDDPTNALLKLIDGVRILEGLSPDHREALILTKYGGYTTAEAAATLGISESAIKARLHRALRTIHRQLDREELPA